MNPHLSHRYEDGPTACVAHPKVITNIRKQIQNSGALSTADIRLGRRMGLIGTERIQSVGLNDGVIFPPAEAYRARVRGVGSSRVDLQACKLEYSIVSPK